jgi:hypothetical protein
VVSLKSKNECEQKSTYYKYTRMPKRSNSAQRYSINLPDAISERQEKVCRNSPATIRLCLTRGQKIYSLTESCKAIDSTPTKSRRTIKSKNKGYIDELTRLGVPDANRIKIKPDIYSSILKQPGIDQNDIIDHLNHSVCVLEGYIFIKNSETTVSGSRHNNVRQGLTTFLRQWNGGVFSEEHSAQTAKHIKITILLLLLLG